MPDRYRPSIESLEARYAPALYTYIGAGGGGNWNNQNNWEDVATTDNGVPGADDLALINN
jgi:hypothetical protein